MSMSFATAILVNWLLMLCLLITSISVAMTLGWRRRFGLATWRAIKLISTLLGAVGVVVFISNVELQIRATTSDTTAHRRLLEFIETKSLILQQIALSCGNRSNELCGLAISSNGSLSYINIRDSAAFSVVGPAPLSTEGQRFYEDLRMRVQDMNNATNFVNDIPAVLSASNRLFILFIGQIFVIAAIAGSVGEATFQFQEARRAQRNVAPKPPVL